MSRPASQAELSAASALFQKKFRKETGTFLAEGIHLITDLARHPQWVEKVFWYPGEETSLPSWLKPFPESCIRLVTLRQLEKLTETGHPQPVDQFCRVIASLFKACLYRGPDGAGRVNHAAVKNNRRDAGAGQPLTDRSYKRDARTPHAIVGARKPDERRCGCILPIVGTRGEPQALHLASSRLNLAHNAGYIDLEADGEIDVGKAQLLTGAYLGQQRAEFFRLDLDGDGFHVVPPHRTGRSSSAVL